MAARGTGGERKKLIAGERTPKVLAQLARARARRKITELQAALEGAEFAAAARM
ncbi:MAG TPA: hypothetical protein VLW44_22915 [Streptosporangiaceae bacterium]|nr:hypothetical protein [Streptosporangiaceae bacterium]